MNDLVGEPRGGVDCGQPLHRGRIAPRFFPQLSAGTGFRILPGVQSTRRDLPEIAVGRRGDRFKTGREIKFLDWRGCRLGGGLRWSARPSHGRQVQRNFLRPSSGSFRRLQTGNA